MITRDAHDVAGRRGAHDPGDRRLRALMDGVDARVWFADLRMARARADALAGPGGDIADFLRGHPEKALEIYRAIRPLRWNAVAERAYGLPDRHPADLLVPVSPERRRHLAGALARMLAGEPRGLAEFRAPTEDGGMFASRFSWAATGPADDPLAEVLVIGLDRWDLGAEEDAWERNEQIRTAVEGSNTAIYMFDSDLLVKWVENPRTRQGFDFTGLDLVECFGQEAGRALEAVFRPIVEEGVTGRVEIELTRDGTTRTFDFSAKPWRDATGRITGLVGVNNEVTERARLVRDLARAAVTDVLTGLANRQGLREALDDVVEEGETGEAAMLLAFDVPGFHAINDVYGHESGDACLRAIADVLRGEAGPDDLVSRFGGDQFAILLRGAGARHAEDEALRLAAKIEALRVDTGDGFTIPLQIVTGMASVDGLQAGRRTAPDLLSDVDVVLSRAKRTREAVVLIEADAEAYRARVRERLDWGSRVRAALDADDLMVLAQPIVDLGTGRTRAFELFARLRVDGEIITAGAFMPDLHLLGMVPLVDRWMLRNAAHIVAEHADLIGDRHVAVNVGATTLAEGGFLRMLDEAIEESGADPTRLVIEMTETEAVADVAAARAVVEGIRARGALFALDDFGSGNAAPDYLHDLPADWVKLDGRFVKGACHSAIDRAIVFGALAIADAIGIPLVAEWIEDEATRDLMAEMGARFGQGFHLGRPGEVPGVLARP